MSDQQNRLRNELLGPLVFFCIGLYCFYVNEYLLDDPGWEPVKNKKLFGCACGAIFCGGALLYLNQSLKPRGYLVASKFSEALGGILTIAGWGYILWTLFF